MAFEMEKREQVVMNAAKPTTNGTTTLSSQTKHQKKPVKMSLTSFMGSRTTSSNSLNSWADEMESHSPTSPSILSGDSGMMRDIVSGFEKGMTVSATRHVGMEQRKTTSYHRSNMGMLRGTSEDDDSSSAWRTKETPQSRQPMEYREASSFGNRSYKSREESFREEDTSWRDGPRQTNSFETTSHYTSSGPSLDKIPDRPPYIAFVGNLPFTVELNELEKFFLPLRLVNARIPQSQGKPKGFAYVEFSNVEDLKKALERHGSNFQGRSIKLDVADGFREHSSGNADFGYSSSGPDRSSASSINESQNWREQPARESTYRHESRAFQRDQDLPTTGHMLNREGGGFDRDRASRAPISRYGGLERSSASFTATSTFMPSSSDQKARTKLNLLPRSTDSEATKPDQDSKSEQEGQMKEKLNPFGSAQPIDERDVMRRVEEKLKQKEEIVSQRLKELETTHASNSLFIERPQASVMDNENALGDEIHDGSSNEPSDSLDSTSHSNSGSLNPSGGLKNRSSYRNSSKKLNDNGTRATRPNTFSTNSSYDSKNRSNTHHGWERVGDMSAARSLASKSRIETQPSLVEQNGSGHAPSNAISTSQNVFTMLSLDVTEEIESGDENLCTK